MKLTNALKSTRKRATLRNGPSPAVLKLKELAKQYKELESKVDKQEYKASRLEKECDRLLDKVEQALTKDNSRSSKEFIYADDLYYKAADKCNMEDRKIFVLNREMDKLSYEYSKWARNIKPGDDIPPTVEGWA